MFFTKLSQIVHMSSNTVIACNFTDMYLNVMDGRSVEMKSEPL